MKRISRAILSALLIITTVCGLCVSASAALPPLMIGDADGDYNITIMDATRVQRWLADYDVLDKLHCFLADVNGDGETNILDATRIQRKLADLGEFYASTTPFYYVTDSRFYADYDSGKARTGAPVTFYAEGMVPGLGSGQTLGGYTVPGRGDLPLTYEFFVNNLKVQERSVNNELVYTFDKPGVYRIDVTIYNEFDISRNMSITDYRVVEPYSLDRPVIVSTLFKDDTHYISGYNPLTVRAEGGEGPYEYMFTTLGIYKGYENDGLFVEEPEDENVIPTLSTGYLKSGVYQIPRGMYKGKEPRIELSLRVYVRDSRGNVSDPVDVYHVIRSIIA